LPESNLTKLPSQRYHEEVAFRPLGTRVALVIEDADLQRTPSGLYMPSKDREKPLQGRAAAVGPEVKEIAAGDLVLFERYCGAPVESNGKPPILILDESDVMAIVEKGGRFPHEALMDKRIADLIAMEAVQGGNGNWNYDGYMLGLENGLLLAIHTMTGAAGEVPYKKAPKKWLKDLPKVKKPAVACGRGVPTVPA
jgi:chaperonin GroES